VIQNEHTALQVKLDNIKNESRLLDSQLAQNRDLERHQESMVVTLQDKIGSEFIRLEELEVQMYEQSVKMATLTEDTEKVLSFMEEFIKR
jgi:hypothetical protein